MKFQGDQRRALTVGGMAHILHDGFTDMFYVFFPVWQTQFVLSVTQVGLLKLMISGAMAIFQMPSGILAGRLGTSRVLVFGTLLSSIAVFLLGWADAALSLGLLLFICGIGSSVQHPLSSTMISNACPDAASRRMILSTYNFCGDIGKFIFPGLAALILSFVDWPRGLQLMSVIGFAVTAAIFLLAGKAEKTDCNLEDDEKPAGLGRAIKEMSGNSRFSSLWLIGVLDSATRMGFLTFFPFLLRDKGADVTIIGLALTILFAGGATGKLVCGVLATRLGVLRTVAATEIATALCIIAMVHLPLSAALCLAPVLGIALNGTSSVLYGTVPELVPSDLRGSAFAMFYTGTIGSSATSPFIFGMVSDRIGVEQAIFIVAVIALFTLPLAWKMRVK